MRTNWKKNVSLAKTFFEFIFTKYLFSQNFVRDKSKVNIANTIGDEIFPKPNQQIDE